MEYGGKCFCPVDIMASIVREVGGFVVSEMGNPELEKKDAKKDFAESICN